MSEPSLPTLFAHPFFINVLLPFLLVFVVIFAILEKTRLLGDKRGIDAIVALVIAILFVSVQKVVGFTLRIIPIVAAMIMILLCIYLLFGFMEIKTTGLIITLGLLFGGAFIILLLWAAGILKKVGEIGGETWATIAFVATIAAAAAVALTSKPSK